jgi:excinuclease ABC subunit C
MQRQDLKSYKIPDSPGVYLFQKKREVLYVGKATSLKDRVKSYFNHDLLQTRGPLIADMIFQADRVKFTRTDSVLEALILEANLIKKYQPKYNTKEKSNKSFNYVIITKEAWPRVLVIREREIKKGLVYKIQEKFGPFTQGESLRQALKIIRKIFPFRDRCIPLIGKPCFNRQLGLCPGMCDGSISQKEYGKVIHKIKLLFSGKTEGLKKNLKQEMDLLAKNQEYEKANEIKKQIFALNHIQDVALVGVDSIQYTVDSLQSDLRIEAYDIAHLSGTNNVGVMVVMENKELKKSDYRKFKIRNSQGNDIGALKEILERRLKHSEWLFPDLIVVDGGLAQLNIAKQIISQINQGFTLIDLVAVTKNEKHQPKAIIGGKNIIKKYKKEILLANHEAHRFALAFHRGKRNAII